MPIWSKRVLEHVNQVSTGNGTSDDLVAVRGALEVLARGEVASHALRRHRPTALLHLTRDGVVVVANELAALRLDQSALLDGQRLVDLVPAIAADNVKTLIGAVVADGVTRSAAVPGLVPECLLTLHRVANLAGGDALVGILEREAEAEQSTLARQSAQDRRYQAVFLRSADAILVFNARHRCVEANPAAYRLLSLPEVGLERVARADLWPQGSRSRTERLVQRQIDGDTGTALECEVATARGEIVAEVSALVAGPASYQLVLRSLEERRSLERERREFEERGFHAEKMEALGRFAGGIIHDVNNILAAVVNYAALIELSGGPEVVQDARAILSVCRRCKQLTGNLLRFTRRGPEVRLACWLQDVIREAVEVLRKLIPDSVTLEVVLEPRALGLLADSAQLVQVVMNLGVNAAHAMPEGGVLTIALTRVHERALVRVTDTGVGIAPDDLHRVVEPFFTTKSTGSGLGLSLAYGTMKAHGGQLLIASKLGVGTTVTLDFPISADAPLPQSRSLPPPGRSGDLSGKVLVIDDEEDIRLSTMRLLRFLGLTASGVETGAAGLALLARGTFDLLVLDLDMPGVDGVQILEAVAAFDSPLPVLVASGYGREYVPAHLSALPTVRFVRKPFRYAELERAVRELLAG